MWQKPCFRGTLMMINPRYDYVYDEVFSFLARHQITLYPVNVFEICQLLRTRIMTMTEIARQSHATVSDVCRICGNTDGAVFSLLSASRIEHTIAYNSAKPIQRQHFTIAEECAHVLLGHACDPRFYIARTANHELYQVYEQEARAAAGLLLCSPKILDLCANALDPKIVSLACDISETCAAVRIDQHRCFGQVMRAHPAYASLPAPRITSSKARAALFQKLKLQSRVKKFA